MVSDTWAFPAARTYLRPVARRRAETERDDREDIDCDTDGTDSHQAENWACDDVSATHFDYQNSEHLACYMTYLTSGEVD